jgi:hypothetical protein
VYESGIEGSTEGGHVANFKLLLQITGVSN